MAVRTPIFEPRTILLGTAIAGPRRPEAMRDDDPWIIRDGSNGVRPRNKFCIS